MPKVTSFCEGEDRKNGPCRNVHQARPARWTCHSVPGFGERHKTAPTAHRRYEWPYRAIAPRVIEAIDQVRRIQRATSSTWLRYVVLSCCRAGCVDTSGILALTRDVRLWLRQYHSVAASSRTRLFVPKRGAPPTDYDRVVRLARLSLALAASAGRRSLAGRRLRH